ncbi:MAG: hypothetical protein RLZZ21_296 [Planctomycetota bacterium]|jgi:hypothetical protein
MSDILADAREFIGDRNERLQTHSANCWRWHPACMVARLARELERLQAENADYRREVREQRLEIAGLREGRKCQ